MKNTRNDFSKGDRVYYLYTKPDGTRVKFVAVVIECPPEGVTIRVGRYDVHSKEISTFESTVNETSLQPRTVPCSYEDELQDRE